MPVTPPPSDPRVTATRIRDCGEPLVDITAAPLLVRPDRTVLLRSGVVDRLVAAQSLLPRSMQLMIVEGYLPGGEHATGGAVDVTLSGQDGQELPMGTHVHPDREPCHPSCHAEATDIPTTGRANRQALRAALTTMGLINYPTWWWHWSYGDRYWAFVTRAAAARYGPVPPS